MGDDEMNMSEEEVFRRLFEQLQELRDSLSSASYALTEVALERADPAVRQQAASLLRKMHRGP